ncbi:hypothetical protein M1M34_gp075 [Haloarcula tailed virus 2]|uniref:Uncharacterized protein n=1 Tax=Haloarcula tailed virus 2 TaxID=2877989 RepID=A0AAE9BYL5_9CAUD|nr:hypothetical protein M1M34_gp075 [Haloarcula tailed virus 2]UBF23258.1 hypothetical protein HATV-2_gp107 [Haloarcula tailed virus 2]
MDTLKLLSTAIGFTSFLAGAFIVKSGGNTNVEMVLLGMLSMLFGCLMVLLAINSA